MELQNTYKLEKYISYDTAFDSDNGSLIPYLETLSHDLTRISFELNEIILPLVSCIMEKFKVKNLIRCSDSILGIFNGLSHQNIINLTDDNKDNLEFDSIKLMMVDLSNRTSEFSRGKYNDLVYISEKLNHSDLILISTGREFDHRGDITILECIENLDLKIVAALIFHDDVSGLTLCPQLRSATSFPEIDPYGNGINFYLISKNMPEHEFIAYASIMNFSQEIIKNFTNENSSDSISTGIYLPPGTYKGPEAWKAREEFLLEEPNFKHWNKFEFKTIAKYHKIKKINKNEKLDQSKFKKILEVAHHGADYQLFIFPFVQHSQNDTGGCKYFLPIEFDINFVLLEFVDMFFQTSIGKNICKIVSLQGYFSIDELDQLWIYAPSIEDQKKLFNLMKIIKKRIKISRN